MVFSKLKKVGTEKGRGGRNENGQGDKPAHVFALGGCDVQGARLIYV
jgi:hypothetical protein